MPTFYYFILSVVALIAGYVFYGAFIERIFKIDATRLTPALSNADGVDYVPMKGYKIWLIQVLNIAGVGPIFGAILGALYGPSALLWIVFGCIFAGAVHDYLFAMISVRHNGVNLPTITGIIFGSKMKYVLQFVCICLLMLVGAVFVTAPALLLADMTPIHFNLWVMVIFIYYFIATIFPIDKVIGRFYPIFGACLLFMAISLIVMLFVKGYPFYQGVSFTDFNPLNLSIWPVLFVTLSCGAISGFHATQSPLMARCITSEKQGRSIFYGAMITEGVIALIWATIGMTFYPALSELQSVISESGPGGVVSQVSYALLGKIGGVLAILGVIILPISSGDTSYRAIRLIIAEMFDFSQIKLKNRLLIVVPMFIIGIILTQINFDVIWQYFGWTNQVLAMLALWIITIYLKNNHKCYLVALIPALFMTAVTSSFILSQSIGLGLSMMTANGVSVGVCILFLILFFKKKV